MTRHVYDFPRPMVTVDCVVFGLDLEAEDLKVLLIQRKRDPFAGLWAFPGGFVEEKETLEQSAYAIDKAQLRRNSTKMLPPRPAPMGPRIWLWRPDGPSCPPTCNLALT